MAPAQPYESMLEHTPKYTAHYHEQSFKPKALSYSIFKTLFLEIGPFFPLSVDILLPKSLLTPLGFHFTNQ